jgi:ABC-type proline/glycine betaine transport system substrate-binding protein
MLTIQSAGKGREQAAAEQWAAANKSVVDTWFAAPTG